MLKHFVEDKAEYGKPTRNVTNIEPMLWCYRHTGDRRLLEMAEKAWEEYLTVAGDPWSNPPPTLEVKARKVLDWELRSNPQKPEQKFTPPLPDLAKSNVAKTVETLKLVPYGCTHLRLTFFPKLSKA